MSWFVTALILVVTGIAAGLLSTMAGMASLVSYPVLIALGLPPVSANVTNTAGMVFTGVGAALSSQKELRAHQRLTLGITIWSLLGALVGSIVLALAPASTFEHIVPFLIAMAGVLMLTASRRQPAGSQNVAARPKSRLALSGRNIAIFLVGVYIGYFGASAGIILISILSLTLDQPFAVSNAIKNFATFAANILSIIVYALTTKVYWLMVVPLGIGLFIGGYTGPIVVRYVPVKLMQRLIAIGAFGLAGYFFYDAYLR